MSVSRAALLLLVLATLSCRPPSAPRPEDDPRYLCRVDVTPLREALRAAGGDPARIVRPADLAGLTALASGRRFKFVLTGVGALAVAPMPSDAAHNEYVHPILGDGAPVRSAGGITVTHDRARVSRVVLDAESRSYCTAAESLRPTVRALRAMGVEAGAIVVEGRPFACVETGGPPKRYGPVMSAIGRRFETLGRAIAARRWELADYELEELTEDLEELPLAAPPPSVHIDLAPAARAFPGEHMAPLARAVERRDATAATAAFGAAAVACNGCHEASGKAAIMVSPRPGELVPWITPATEDGGVSP
ncbi:MAG: hypothetical protein IPF99_14605 [Deltaproteobacteria bacterium]|jgi:hypothetical protein|nr:hypothetical protein [Deltaproteobacteria bacterium]